LWACRCDGALRYGEAARERHASNPCFRAAGVLCRVGRSRMRPPRSQAPHVLTRLPSLRGLHDRRPVRLPRAPGGGSGARRPTLGAALRGRPRDARQHGDSRSARQVPDGPRGGRMLVAQYSDGLHLSGRDLAGRRKLQRARNPVSERRLHGTSGASALRNVPPVGRRRTDLRSTRRDEHMRGRVDVSRHGHERVVHRGGSERARGKLRHELRLRERPRLRSYGADVWCTTGRRIGVLGSLRMRLPARLQRQREFRDDVPSARRRRRAMLERRVLREAARLLDGEQHVWSGQLAERGPVLRRRHGALPGGPLPHDLSARVPHGSPGRSLLYRGRPDPDVRRRRGVLWEQMCAR